MSLLIRNARIVTSVDDLVADVFADNGRTEAIGRRLAVHADRVVDATGLLLLPGGVDPHTHLAYDLGETRTSDDYATGTIAAALGGTTTVINFTRSTAGQGPLDAVHRTAIEAGEVAAIDFGQHYVVDRVDDGTPSQLAALVDQGVTSFKMFMAYPGELMLDDRSIFRVLRFAGAHGAMCCIHAENGPIVDEFVAEALRAGHTSPAWHGRTRPTIAEAEATHRALELARLAEAPVYIVHVSCREALDEVIAARDRGQAAHAETCPQYLLLDSRAYDDEESFDTARYVFTPPLRSSDDQRALWRGLMTGDLEVVATDHCPFSLDGQKSLGRDDFSRIPNGAPGIENRLQLLYGLGVRTGRISLHDLVALTATRPARLFGLTHKGRVAVGADADYVLLDPDSTTTISADTQHMNVDYNLFEGLEVPGRIRMVTLGGRPIAEDGVFVGEPGQGRFVARGPSGQR